MTNCITALVERLQPEHVRLSRLYEALRQVEWPELRSGQVIKQDGSVTFVDRPEVTPEQIARVITDPACLDELRRKLLKAHEAKLWQAVRKNTR